MILHPVIFSRRRPAQLDLLARSMSRFLPSAPYTAPIVTSGEAFERQVRAHLNYARDRHHAVLFLVDDAVFIRPAVIPETAPFSYRLGDYHYYFTLDGGIYDPEEVLSYLDFTFTNPTQLEAGIAVKVEARHHDAYYPCLVGIPANRVSESSGMPHMGQDVEALNERWRAGGRISLDAVIRDVRMDGGAHQNIVYEWED